jgi:hypothetical protein
VTAESGMGDVVWRQACALCGASGEGTDEGWEGGICSCGAEALGDGWWWIPDGDDDEESA